MVNAARTGYLVLIIATAAACGPRDDTTRLAATAAYQVGSEPPELRLLEPGAGEYASETPTLSSHALKRMIVAKLNAPDSPTSYGPDAVNHLKHYFDNTGEVLALELTRLVSETQGGRDALDAELAAAKAFASTLPVGRHVIVASEATVAYISANDSSNWNKAVAAYHGYGTAEVEVSESGTVTMAFVYHLWDPYDWEPTDQVVFRDSATGLVVTNNTMGKFHRQGLAREYLVVGEHAERLTW